MDRRKIGPLPIHEVKQKGGTFYSASIKARDLVSITYSDVRRLVDDERDVEKYLGVQRPINNSRVKKIRDYILSPDPTFPTAIIVAVDEACVAFNEKMNEITLMEVREQDVESIDDEPTAKPIPFERIALVLDGQHRLAGFLNDKDEFDIGGTDFDLNVSIFVGADISVQAQIFATVNLAQTKVSKSLVYELEDLSKVRSPYKTSHNIAVALDSYSGSPFHKRIKRLGFVTPGRSSETISQAAFVEALTDLISRNPGSDRNAFLEGRKLSKAEGAELLRTPFRNLFIDERDLDIADNVKNYFEAIKRKWPKAWSDTSRQSGILPKTNAFRAFMRFLRDIYPELATANRAVVSADEYLNRFKDVKLEDRDLTTRTFKPGSSGQSAFYKVLSGQVRPSELFEDLPS